MLFDHGSKGEGIIAGNISREHRFVNYSKSAVFAVKLKDAAGPCYQT